MTRAFDTAPPPWQHTVSPRRGRGRGPRTPRSSPGHARRDRRHDGEPRGPVGRLRTTSSTEVATEVPTSDH